MGCYREPMQNLIFIRGQKYIQAITKTLRKSERRIAIRFQYRYREEKKKHSSDLILKD